MAVTHNAVLVANGKTVSAQSNFVHGVGQLVKMDTDELTLEQQIAVLRLLQCVGEVGDKFGAIVTTLTIGAIP